MIFGGARVHFVVAASVDQFVDLSVLRPFADGFLGFSLLLVARLLIPQAGTGNVNPTFGSRRSDRAPRYEL